jgi:putative transposase
MPFIKVYLHLVWSTKIRIPFLETKQIRQSVWDHIKANSELKDVFIDYVNGYDDHCHCLVSLGASQTISKIMQLIKGESAHWINKQEILKGTKYDNGKSIQKFEWQDEYYAVSVSESHVEKVRNYIKYQEIHHATKSTKYEFDLFIKKYGFVKINDKM